MTIEALRKPDSPRTARWQIIREPAIDKVLPLQFGVITALPGVIRAGF
jgi:hypothetical protein